MSFENCAGFNIIAAGCFAGFRFGAERSGIFLFQLREVPKSERLIQGARDDQVLCRVELGAHNIMSVSRQNGQQTSALIVPYSHSLII